MQSKVSDDPYPVLAHYPPTRPAKIATPQGQCAAVYSNSVLTASPYFKKNQYEKILKQSKSNRAVRSFDTYENLRIAMGPRINCKCSLTHKHILHPTMGVHRITSNSVNCHHCLACSATTINPFPQKPVVQMLLQLL